MPKSADEQVIAEEMYRYFNREWRDKIQAALRQLPRTDTAQNTIANLLTDAYLCGVSDGNVISMTYWLIAYNRKRGELLSCDPFEDSRAALAERFRLERDAHPDVEIVVLGADSLEALKVTHGRYFYNEGNR